ncbi:MAG: 2-phospho-L-lactate transferase CofD family protein [Thermodesulfobacteriota bacterium]
MLRQVNSKSLSPLDLLPHGELREKLVELALSGVPDGLPPETTSALQKVRDGLARASVEDLNVVVFGGGTGLSTIVGGDSRSQTWVNDPFSGLKALFPKTRSVVCVTDDGGSTGELLKDLPLIALGDIRHVLLSSIQLANLQELYGLTELEAVRCVERLAGIFNHRFSQQPAESTELKDECGLTGGKDLPPLIAQTLGKLIDNLFTDPRLEPILRRPHCLGNLILASSVYEQLPPHHTTDSLVAEGELLRQNLHRGIASLCVILGADEQAVVPCADVPAELSVRYGNGVQVTGEHKSGHARRTYALDRVTVNFCGEPTLHPSLTSLVENADIMILAPGSLYSSLLPVLQVPGIARAMKKNSGALKILVSNLWVQSGETDLSPAEPERKFLLSDLLKAYERNIPGGTDDLFDMVLCLSLKDVPASVIQNYAVEGKVPIYLDREKVQDQGVLPLECTIYSKAALRDHGVIRHDPAQFSRVVRTLWGCCRELPIKAGEKTAGETDCRKGKDYLTSMQIPCLRYRKIEEYLQSIPIELQGGGEGKVPDIRTTLLRILWEHKDISLSHLQFVQGVQCISTGEWKRDQNWDRVFSFYDPTDAKIKIRQDQFDVERHLETAFLVALGQSLLGDYSAGKSIQPLVVEGNLLGKVYHLHLRESGQRNSYFDDQDLADYLILARMVQDEKDEKHFTRLVNGSEGFTPPGLLFGLIYAWYLDNRFASHIEYKMAITKIAHFNLIPEQVRMKSSRENLIRFFREVVFPHKPQHS